MIASGSCRSTDDLEKEVMRTRNMKFKTTWKKLGWLMAWVVALLILLGYAQLSFAQGSKPKTFSSPAEAGNALFSAVQNNDEQELESILGAGKELCSSGSEVEDKLEREHFSQKYQEMHRLVRELDGSTVLYVGAENWPFPVPLLSNQGRWYFDSNAGMQEIRFRQVGENEMTAIRVLNAFAQAEKQGKTATSGDEPTSRYAQELLTAGSKDADNKLRAPQDNVSSPFHGYYFRIVRENAAAGSDRHVSGSKNTAGLALVAYPAEYGSSGITTFITQDGTVRERDLGPKTETLATKMEMRPDLDSSWKAVE
jgi:hypothetical protein